MKIIGISLIGFIILTQMILLIGGLIIRVPSSSLNRQSKVLSVASIPLTTRQVGFNVGVGSGRRPNGALSINTSGGTNTLEGATLNVLRRGTDLAADALVNAVGGVATLINMIQNYIQTGSIQFNNLSSSAQVLTSRLLNLGSNAATSILQQLNSEISATGTGIGGGGSSSGVSLPVSSSQLITSANVPVTQVANRQSTLTSDWPQTLLTLISGGAGSSGLSGILGQRISALLPQQRIDTRIGTGNSMFQRPAVGVSNTSGAGRISGTESGGIGITANTNDNLDRIGITGVNGITGWGGNGGVSGTTGWGNTGGIDGTIGWGNNAGASGTSGWTSTGSASGIPIGNLGGTIGWGDIAGMNAPAGWGGASGSIGWGGTGGSVGWSNTGGTAGWNGSSNVDSGSDEVDFISGMYGSGNSNVTVTSTIPSLAETVLSPSGTLSVNSTNVNQTNEESNLSSGSLSLNTVPSDNQILNSTKIINNDTLITNS